MADSPGARRRGAWAPVAAATAGVVVLAWWLSREPARRPVEATVAPVASALPADVPAPRATPGPEPATSSSAEPAPPSDDAPVAIKPQCGVDERPVGLLPPELAASAADAGVTGDPDPDTPPSPPPRPAGPGYVAATNRLDAAMRASDDPFTRAVADWLDLRDQRTPDERVEMLARTAASTADPRVYALAYKACLAPHGTAPSCDGLSARSWAQLDAGNAEPWAYVYADATRAGDASGQQDALFHAAASTRYASRYFDVPAAVAAAAPPDAQDLAADEDATVAAMNRGGAFVFGGVGLVAACPASGAMDANRAQLCARIGTLMLDHSDTLMHALLGARLVARATGDTARLDALHEEQRRLAEKWQPATGLSECTAMRNTLRDMRRRAQVGELAFLREQAVEAARP